ncbi:hypothetical protein HOY80DRAFT_978536 [Tuber brumale]|nr:hypothetical protein HOY80DRAFT_978536 [Tuber brumale]
MTRRYLLLLYCGGLFVNMGFLYGLIGSFLPLSRNWGGGWKVRDMPVVGRTDGRVSGMGSQLSHRDSLSGGGIEGEWER